MAVGSFIGGYLYKIYGGPMTFRIFGIGAFIVCILHCIVHRFIGKNGVETVDKKNVSSTVESRL